MDFLDTQIISYAFRRATDYTISGKHISSVVANEFLEAHSPDPRSARYYIPTKVGWLALNRRFMSQLREGVQFFWSKRPKPRSWTDEVTLHFGDARPAITEFGSLGISLVINKANTRLFDAAITSLDNRTRRRLRRRLDFLLAEGICCHALTRRSARIALHLVQEYEKEFSLKKNFRNSISDLLTLAVALDHRARLVTIDSVLSRFARTTYACQAKHEGTFVILDLQTLEAEKGVRSRESKGYINRRWYVTCRNYGFLK